LCHINPPNSQIMKKHVPFLLSLLGIMSLLAWTATVRAQCNIVSQTVTVPQSVSCSPSIMAVNLLDSEVGVRYVTRNQSTGLLFGTQAEGTGNPLTLSTDIIYSTTTFDVWASSGQALDFDGVDDYVSLGSPSQLAFSNGFSIEMWVQFDDLANTDQVLLGKDDIGERQLLVAYTGEIRVVYYNLNGSPLWLVSDPNPITDNNWHHIVVQRLSGILDGFEIYLDGELIKSGISAGSSVGLDVASTVSDLRIGSRSYPGYEDYFDGRIDEVRVWNAPRTLTEIQDNMYAAMSGSEANLVAYYNMEGAVPSTSLTDLTSNSIQGTLTNMNTNNAWVPGIIGLCDAVMDGTPTISIGAATSNAQSISICDGESITIGSNTYSAAGNYTDILINSSGCDSTLTTTVTVNADPQPNLGADVFICSNQSISLTPGFSFSSYNWSNSSITNSIVVAGNSSSIGSNEVWVEVEDANGCTNSDTMNVIVGEISASSQNLELCHGESIVIGTNTYTTGGIYTETFINSVGCDSVRTTTVTEHQLPQPDLGPDVTICHDQPTTLSPSGGSFDSYSWSNSSTASSIVVDITSGVGTHEFWVEVEHDFNGCFNSDTINVTIEVCAGINETNESNPMKLFPNPATNVVTVRAVNLEQIQLLDVSGRLLKGINISGVGQVDLDISALPSGIYFIEATLKDGIKQTERLMKQ